MGGYTMPSTLVAPANESDVDDDTTASDDVNDGDASSPSNDGMST